MIQAAGFGPLMTGIGRAALAQARPAATARPAVPLAAKARPAEEKGSQAVRLAATDFQQDQTFPVAAIRHVSRGDWTRHAISAILENNCSSLKSGR
jgi:hypothetical protein